MLLHAHTVNLQPETLQAAAEGKVIPVPRGARYVGLGQVSRRDVFGAEVFLEGFGPLELLAGDVLDLGKASTLRARIPGGLGYTLGALRWFVDDPMATFFFYDAPPAPPPTRQTCWWNFHEPSVGAGMTEYMPSLGARSGRLVFRRDVGPPDSYSAGYAYFIGVSELSAVGEDGLSPTGPHGGTSWRPVMLKSVSAAMYHEDHDGHADGFTLHGGSGLIFSNASAGSYGPHKTNGRLVLSREPRVNRTFHATQENVTTGGTYLCFASVNQLGRDWQPHALSDDQALLHINHDLINNVICTVYGFNGNWNQDTGVLRDVGMHANYVAQTNVFPFSQAQAEFTGRGADCLLLSVGAASVTISKHEIKLIQSGGSI